MFPFASITLPQIYNRSVFLLHINIVELGLIYRIESMPAHVLIEMTMTSPACPMGDLIEDDARQELARGLPPGRQVELRLVWEPPWDPSMMSESARTHFGW